MGHFFIFFLFFGINKHTAKASQCMKRKLGTQIGYSNLTCNVILILLPYHLLPLAGALNTTVVGKFGDSQCLHCRISEAMWDRAVVTITVKKLKFKRHCKGQTIKQWRPFCYVIRWCAFSALNPLAFTCDLIAKRHSLSCHYKWSITNTSDCLLYTSPSPRD